MTRRITLEAWIALTYEPGCAPKINTVRAWAKNKKLDPPAVKEGRSYYVEPDTRYNDRPDAKPKSLLSRVRAAEASRSEKRGPAA